jgi:NADPH-dependent curcumin reductase CurA
VRAGGWMSETLNRKVVLKARPRGMPVPDDVGIVEAPVPEPAAGEVLVRNAWLGLAPAARLRMNAEGSYTAPMALGDVLHCQSVGTVVASAREGFAPGDPVVAMQSGWQAYSLIRGPALYRIDPALAPPQAWLGVLGSSGQTAWIGLTDIGAPRPGETVLVSAAAGAVGAIAGQVAKLRGARAVGIAGGPAKCAMAVSDYGYDACVDYRAPDFPDALAAACPDGVDVYFDNVGGAVRDAAWTLMRPFGRIVVCGLVSEYNTAFVRGPEWYSFLTKRLTVRGFIMSDHADRRPACVAELGEWYRQGRIRLHEDAVDGLENAMSAFLRMLRGENRGKTLVRLA